MVWFWAIIFSILLIVVVALIFSFVEVKIGENNGWLVRWIKHLKCGAIHGHAYHAGSCARCGKAMPKHKHELNLDQYNKALLGLKCCTVVGNDAKKCVLCPYMNEKDCINIMKNDALESMTTFENGGTENAK